MLIGMRSLDGEIAVLDVTGRLTVEAGAALGGAVGKILQMGRRRLVLNLTGVSTMDAAGLGELAHSAAMAQAAAGELLLVVRNPAIQELLARTQLLGVLRAFPTEAEAICSFEVTFSR
jgi:anti-anti-sigma factor